MGMVGQQSRRDRGNGHALSRHGIDRRAIAHMTVDNLALDQNEQHQLVPAALGQ